MQDRRTEDRRRVLMAGHLVTTDAGARAECILRDTSAGGARLLVAAPQGLPRDVAIVVAPGGVPRRARIVWRDATAVGVAYVEAERAAPPARCAVVSLAAVRAARAAPGDAGRLAERIAAVTGPRSVPLPSWVRRP